VKRAIYATLALFIGILIVAWVIAGQHPVRSVKYQDDHVVETGK
jgi:hypothetical protein